jgi:Zn-dependent M28 family amino/carboxypeptidase
LASDALQGRGSATRDEAIAAAYVASQFEAAGLRPAPGMVTYLQTLPVPRDKQTATVLAGATVTNAIGYLPGRDPTAGVLLFSAHLDHLGLVKGVAHPGANDDASGTTAVIELAKALAAGGAHRRGILFVCYGGEELGGVGSNYFGQHPPIALSQIIANIEFEMIGSQDPKLPPGRMMMTGFERSNLGPALAARGFLVAPDPYPEEHFFERSDNYQLALRGVVAHTISGWATTPTYHRPTDNLSNIDVAYMTRAIQSLIAPAKWLANSNFRPQWISGGQPKR